MAEREVVVAGRGQLHRVLEQTGAGREAAFGQPRHPRIVARQGLVDPIEVDAVVRCDHEELVRRGELDVAPDVGEDLGQLRLERRETKDRPGDLAKELLGHRDALLVAARDDLRQLGKLLHGLALGHALGTERDVNVTPQPGDEQRGPSPWYPGRQCFAKRCTDRRPGGEEAS